VVNGVLEEENVYGLDYYHGSCVVRRPSEAI
jgi:hypothetical protein